MHAGRFSELYCQRCPKLKSASDYALLLVAVSDARRHHSSALQLLAVSTRDVTPPTFLTAPSVSNIGESNFTLTLALSEPGKMEPGHVQAASIALGHWAYSVVAFVTMQHQVFQADHK